MTINFPARRSGVHYRGTDVVRPARPTLSRRTLLKLGAGTTAAAAAGAYGLDRTLTRTNARNIGLTQTARPIKNLTIVGTDGWISMPTGTAPSGTSWPDAFAPAGRDVYVFGFAVGGRFDTPNRLQWADYWNGAPNTPAVAVGGLAGLKNRANVSAPVLYWTEGDDIRLTLWNGGMGNRPDIVDAHTVHFHGFPNQIPYFDGVPNDSLSVPIGANLVYRYLPYRGMAGTYMYHCHVSDAEHVQMGLQGVVFIRPYQNYGIAPDGSPIQKARAVDPTLVHAPLGYVFNDGIDPYGTGYTAGKQYAAGSTAYDREFAFILDELDPRIHSDDAHFQDQDFTQYSPRFGIMNGRAWPDTVAGNWDITTADWTGPARADFRYNIATVDQVLAAGDLADINADPTLLSDQVRAQKGKPKLKIDPKAYVTSQQRLGSQPFSSLIQANAGETIVLRFSNLGYAEHSMELAGLPFRLIGMDAKNLLADRDGYEENPNPALNNSANSPLIQKRADISSNTFRTSINVAESRDLLVQVPHEAFNPDGSPLVFEFFDRNDLFTKNAMDGQPVVGGMRTQLHVFPPTDYQSGQYSLPPQQYPQQVFIPTTPGSYYK